MCMHDGIIVDGKPEVCPGRNCPCPCDSCVLGVDDDNETEQEFWSRQPGIPGDYRY